MISKTRRGRRRRLQRRLRLLFSDDISGGIRGRDVHYRRNHGHASSTFDSFVRGVERVGNHDGVIDRDGGSGTVLISRKL